MKTNDHLPKQIFLARGQWKLLVKVLKEGTWKDGSRIQAQSLTAILERKVNRFRDQ